MVVTGRHRTVRSSRLHSDGHRAPEVTAEVFLASGLAFFISSVPMLGVPRQAGGFPYEVSSRYGVGRLHSGARGYCE